jgi:hypothetical protein
MNEMHRLRGKLVDEIVAHEARAHDGGACGERLSIVAFFCHGLGIGPEDFGDLANLVLRHKLMHDREQYRSPN